MIIGEATRSDLDRIERHQRESIRLNNLGTGRVHEKFWKVRPVEESKRPWANVGDSGPALAVLGGCPLPDQPDWGFVWPAGASELDLTRLGFLHLTTPFLGLVYGRDHWLGLNALVSDNNPISCNWVARWMGFGKIAANPNPPYIYSHLTIHRLQWWEGSSQGRGRPIPTAEDFELTDPLPPESPKEPLS